MKGQQEHALTSASDPQEPEESPVSHPQDKEHYESPESEPGQIQVGPLSEPPEYSHGCNEMVAYRTIGAEKDSPYGMGHHRYGARPRHSSWERARRVIYIVRFVQNGVRKMLVAIAMVTRPSQNNNNGQIVLHQIEHRTTKVVTMGDDLNGPYVKYEQGELILKENRTPDCSYCIIQDIYSAVTYTPGKEGIIIGTQLPVCVFSVNTGEGKMSLAAIDEETVGLGPYVRPAQLESSKPNDKERHKVDEGTTNPAIFVSENCDGEWCFQSCQYQGLYLDCNLKKNTLHLREQTDKQARSSPSTGFHVLGIRPEDITRCGLGKETMEWRPGGEEVLFIEEIEEGEDYEDEGEEDVFLDEDYVKEEGKDEAKTTDEKGNAEGDPEGASMDEEAGEWPKENNSEGDKDSSKTDDGENVLEVDKDTPGKDNEEEITEGQPKERRHLEGDEDQSKKDNGKHAQDIDKESHEERDENNEPVDDKHDKQNRVVMKQLSQESRASASSGSSHRGGSSLSLVSSKSSKCGKSRKRIPFKSKQSFRRSLMGLFAPCCGLKKP